RDDAEEPLQRRLRDVLRGDAAEQAPGGGRDLEHHPEAEVDQLIAGAARADRRRGCDDRGEADRRSRLEREAERERQKRNEEDAAAEPEGHAEPPCGCAGAKDDERENWVQGVQKAQMVRTY